MTFPSMIVMPVSDMTKAIAIYQTLLGVEPYVAEAYYAGFKVGDGEIGLDPHGNSNGPLPYWDVEELDAVIANMTAAGATLVKPPVEVGGGLTIAVLADADGNQIGLRHSS